MQPDPARIRWLVSNDRSVWYLLVRPAALLLHETQPAKTVAELARADERLEREFPLIRLPRLGDRSHGVVRP